MTELILQTSHFSMKKASIHIIKSDCYWSIEIRYADGTVDQGHGVYRDYHGAKLVVDLAQKMKGIELIEIDYGKQ